jgi:hypothetical protein
LATVAIIPGPFDGDCRASPLVGARSGTCAPVIREIISVRLPWL